MRTKPHTSSALNYPGLKQLPTGVLVRFWAIAFAPRTVWEENNAHYAQTGLDQRWIWVITEGGLLHRTQAGALADYANKQAAPT